MDLEMEKRAEKQEQKLMRTWAEINLDNLTHNIDVIRRKVGPKTKILGVVKGDAYGHGAMRVAALYAFGFDFHTYHLIL